MYWHSPPSTGGGGAFGFPNHFVEVRARPIVSSLYGTHLIEFLLGHQNTISSAQLLSRLLEFIQ